MRLSAAVLATALTSGNAFQVAPTLRGNHGASRSVRPLMSVDPSKVLRRAEFWEPESCTVLDVVNVLGRWETSSEWATRDQFAVVEKARAENMAQGASVERFEYAKRNNLGERVALVLNAPKLPFKDEKLAASVGKTVEEMNALPVNKVAAKVLFDSLAQSKSSLIPQKTLDQRRASLIDESGGFNEGAFLSGMIKSRIAVIVGFFLLGKGQLYGYLLVGKVVLDQTGTYDLIKETLGPYTDPIILALTLGAVWYTYQSDAEVKRSTGDFETFSKEEAEERAKDTDRSTTIFEKFQK